MPQFIADDEVAAVIRKQTGGVCSDQLRIGMDKTSFAKTVMPDMRTMSAAKIWREYQRTTKS